MAGRKIFLTEKKEYNAAEILKIIHDHLPQLVKVTEGCRGESIEETFDRDEILLIGAVSQQRRVVTKVQPPKGRCRVLSIPASFDEKLCVVGQTGQAYINNILMENKLPLVVQFPPDRVITIGRKRLQTDRIPAMELIETFEAINLLGSRILDGSDKRTAWILMRLGGCAGLSGSILVANTESTFSRGAAQIHSKGELNEEEIVHIPLYVTQLRMSIISGIKGHSKQQWKQFLADIEHKSIQVEYDMEYGNPNIEEYRHDENPIGKMYAYEEPIRHDNIINIIKEWSKVQVQEDDKQKTPVSEHFYTDLITDEENLEYEFSTSSSATNLQETSYELPSSKNIQDEPEEDDPQHIYEDLVLKETNCTESTSNEATKSRKSPVKYRKIKTPETKGQVSDSEDLQRIANQRNPILPKPAVKFSEPGYQERKMSKRTVTTPGISTDLSQQIYKKHVNKMHRPDVAPVIYANKVLEDIPDPSSSSRVEGCDTDPSNSQKQTRLSEATIAELSIQDVCEFLNKLNLKAYKDSFVAQMIDGAMLIELDLDVLMEEFGMKKVEALRLMKFAREGHLPKIT